MGTLGFWSLGTGLGVGTGLGSARLDSMPSEGSSGNAGWAVSSSNVGDGSCSNDILASFCTF